MVAHIKILKEQFAHIWQVLDKIGLGSFSNFMDKTIAVVSSVKTNELNKKCLKNCKDVNLHSEQVL